MLPDAVYAQGFLKTYANFLGLDGEALSQQLKSRRKPRRERGINYNAPSSDFERPLIIPGGMASTFEKRRVSTSAIVTLIVALLALAAVIGTLYFVGRGVQLTRAEEDTPPAATADKPEGGTGEGSQNIDDGAGSEAELVYRAEGAAGEETDAETQAEETTAGQGAPTDTLLVAVTVQDRPAWLLVRSDGVLAYEETAAPGFTQTFEAERQLSITSGDAGAVAVEVNGQEVGTLGGVGEVVTKSFTLKSAS